MTASTIDRTYSETGLDARVEAHELDFALDARQATGTATVVARGELDIATVPLLCAALAAHRLGPVHRVEVDLSGVTFLDSYAAGSIDTARVSLADCGIVLLLKHPSPQVARVLELAGYGGAAG